MNTPRFVAGVQTSRLEYFVAGPTDYPVVHDIALTLAAYTAAIRNYTEREWQPVSAGFEYSSPQAIDEYHRVFGDTLLFDQPVSYIEIQNHLLHTKIREIEPDLLRVVSSYVDELIEQARPSATVYERARAVMISAIGNESINLESVAARLHMSRASLQRRLAEEGTGFRRLREQVVYHLARQALTNTQSSISDIALMLGYAEASAFDRAFIRLSGGVAPLRYRRDTAASPR